MWVGGAQVEWCKLYAGLGHRRTAGHWKQVAVFYTILCIRLCMIVMSSVYCRNKCTNQTNQDVDGCQEADISDLFQRLSAGPLSGTYVSVGRMCLKVIKAVVARL